MTRHDKQRSLTGVCTAAVCGLLPVLAAAMAHAEPLSTGAATRPATSPASAPASAPAMPEGRVIPLRVGTLFVPAYLKPHGDMVDVLVHFHGDTATVARNLTAARLQAVLIDVTYPGLSAAYTRPFQDRELFGQILQDGLDRLRESGLASGNPRWGRINVSSFSAGFGAVREILKEPRYFDQIDGLYMADSLYAGYVGDPAGHQVDPENMRDFRRFAEVAAAGRKVFISTHSYLVPGTYASTIETADDLVRHIGAARRAVDEPGPGGMRIVSRCAQGGFRLYGCAGTDGPAHMQHLRNMARWLPELPLARH